ncbi:MAG: MBL fold metallo-hydrolase, partial [Thermoprotei archaeon]
VLTHAHLYHSGALPLLYISANPPLYTNNLTIDLSEILLNDFLKISKYYVPYESVEISATKRNFVNVNYDEVFKVNNLELRLYNAGHIPGSSMVFIKTENHNIVYTGDFNINDSCLLSSAPLKPFKEADVVIMEGTYASYDHPVRKQNEKIFVDCIEEVLGNKGTVLIPSFAVGRAQEILCVLAKYDVSYPIYLDGMARLVSELLARNKAMLRSPKLFKKAYSMARKINGWEMRKRALREPSIIISPAGLLKGGASVFYMEKVMDDSRNAVFFVSYLMKETPARKVIETGVFTSEKKMGSVKARVEWFDFSSHCGRGDLLKVVDAARKSSRIILVHSEKEVGEEFARYLIEEKNKEVYFPKTGEEIVIER